MRKVDKIWFNFPCSRRTGKACSHGRCKVLPVNALCGNVRNLQYDPFIGELWNISNEQTDFSVAKLYNFEWLLPECVWQLYLEPIKRKNPCDEDFMKLLGE